MARTVGIGANKASLNNVEEIQNELVEAKAEINKLKTEIESLKNSKPLTAVECKKLLTEKGITFDEKAKVDELRKLVEENQ